MADKEVKRFQRILFLDIDGVLISTIAQKSEVVI